MVMQQLRAAADAAGKFDRNVIAQYTERLMLAREVGVKQGNLEPVVGTVRFTTDGASQIAAGTFRTVFAEACGQSANSGIVQTDADSTFFGGKIPAGVMFILFGMGFEVEATQLTVDDISTLCRNTSVQVNLRQTPVKAGSLRDWPSVSGPRGQGNGNLDNGYKPLEPAIVLQPLEDFTIVVEVQRTITLSQANTNYDLHVTHPNVRIYDPLVLGKS